GDAPPRPPRRAPSSGGVVRTNEGAAELHGRRRLGGLLGRPHGANGLRAADLATPSPLGLDERPLPGVVAGPARSLPLERIGGLAEGRVAGSDPAGGVVDLTQ